MEKKEEKKNVTPSVESAAPVMTISMETPDLMEKFLTGIYYNAVVARIVALDDHLDDAFEAIEDVRWIEFRYSQEEEIDLDERDALMEKSMPYSTICLLDPLYNYARHMECEYKVIYKGVDVTWDIHRLMQSVPLAYFCEDLIRFSPEIREHDGWASHLRNELCLENRLARHIRCVVIPALEEKMVG